MCKQEKLTADEVFKQAESSQEWLHWALQWLGFIFLFLGFKLILDIGPAVFRIIPFVGIYIHMFGSWIVIGGLLGEASEFR